MKILDERELKMMDYLRLKSQLDHCFLTQMAAKNKEDRQKTIRLAIKSIWDSNKHQTNATTWAKAQLQQAITKLLAVLFQWAILMKDKLKSRSLW
jgi:hypothetical protein